MKKLELNQMENLDGGVNQRNCGVMGLVIGVSALFCWTAVGIGICSGAIIAAASSKCF